MKKVIKFGNSKLPTNTAIFNLGTALDCPSKKLGMCKHHKICYARKAGKMYSSVLPYRKRQAGFWQSVSAGAFVKDFSIIIGKKRKPVEYLRFNESGDLYDQKSLDKMEK